MLPAVAHHLLKDAQPVHEQPLATPGQLAPVCILGMAFHGMEYPFGKFRSAILDVLPIPSLLCSSLLADHGKLKSP